MIKGDSRTRKITYYSQGRDDLNYEFEASRPTRKQKSFFKMLVAKCVENGVDQKLGKHLSTRVDYADAIDTLLDRLREAGVQVKGNDEKFSALLVITDDKEVGLIPRQRLVPEKDIRKKPAVDYGMAAAQRALRK